MQTPPLITFRNMPVDPLLEDHCRAEIAKLERYGDDLYEVHIRLHVPGSELVIDRTPPGHSDNEQVMHALRNAIDSARRRLEDWLRVRRGMIKHHDAGPASKG